MTPETEASMCENVIGFLQRALEKQDTIDQGSVMSTYDITKEQFDNCYFNTEMRAKK